MGGGGGGIALSLIEIFFSFFFSGTYTRVWIGEMYLFPSGSVVSSENDVEVLREENMLQHADMHHRGGRIFHCRYPDFSLQKQDILD